MDFLFNSEENNGNKETDPAVKISKYVLPLLVYIPIIIFLILIGSTFGVKIYKYIVDGGGISKFIERNIIKIFGMKETINKFINKTVDTYWPDKNSIVQGEKTWKHVRLDSTLVLTGSLFILVMVIIYNYDYIKSLMFSKVSENINKAQQKLNKKSNIKNKGAKVSIGKPEKQVGKIINKYDGEFYYDTPFSDDINDVDLELIGLNANYIQKNEDSKKMLNDQAETKKTYILYDIILNGRTLKKVNNEHLAGQFLDPMKNVGGSEDEKIAAARNGEVGDKVYIKTENNVYDHNIFNVYDTNTSIDFIEKTLSFINNDSKDPFKDIDNWEAHLDIPKKKDVKIIRWGEGGVKKGVFSLSVNGQHNGFTLGIKGNGAYKKDPLNNYIFKDKNGKTYQVQLENYGVKKYGDMAYIPGFKITYKIRINSRKTHDVEIYINDRFGMKLPDCGVPINQIKWCGSPKKSHLQVSVEGNNLRKKDVEESMQFFVESEDIISKCEEDEQTKFVNGKVVCVQPCTNNSYFDLFTKNCKACPSGMEIKNNTEYPLEMDCQCPDNEDGKKQYYDYEKRECVNTADGDLSAVSNQFGVSNFNIDEQVTTDLMDTTDSQLKKNQIVFVYRLGKIVGDECKLESDGESPGNCIIDETDISYNKYPKRKAKIISIETSQTGEENTYTVEYLDREESETETESGLKKVQLKQPSEFTSSAGGYYSNSPGIAAKLSEFDENKDKYFAENQGIEKMMQAMDYKLQEELIKTGGLSVSNESLRKSIDMPTLTVYQTTVIRSKKEREAMEYPIQKDESGIPDRLFNFIAPFTWFKIKRNVKNNTPNVSGRGIAKRNSTVIGGIALFFGFLIFTSLLVTQHNAEVLNAEPEKLKDIFIDKTGYYSYLIIFVGMALGLFSLLLFYAATSDAGSRFLSILVIVLSAVIILAALAVRFRNEIEQFVKKNPYIRFIYHLLFVIPCLFVDVVNFIYYEFKSSPKIVFIVFAIEVSIILSLLLLPKLRKMLYLYIFADKDKKKNIDLKIINLEYKISSLESGISRIKSFDPYRDPLVRIDLNSTNNIITKKMVRNEDDEFEDEITPENTDVIGIVSKFLRNKKDEIFAISKKINPFDSISISPGFNSAAWNIIIKRKLYKRDKNVELKKFLYGYGFKTPSECDYMPKKKADNCKLVLEKMVKHIQVNALNIIIFNSTIDEVKSEIKNLKEIKSRSSSIYDKGVVALNKPVYFRQRRYLPIKDFNKNQLEKLKHNYSLSLWFYVHSQPPNYSNEYNREAEILSYNGSPTVYYYGKKNELIIRTKRISDSASEDGNTSISLANIKELNGKLKELNKKLEKAQKIKKTLKEKSESVQYYQISGEIAQKIRDKDKEIEEIQSEIENIEYDIIENKRRLEDNKNDMIVLYKKGKFKLQKWHNLVINYVGGTVDIFLDGELVASTKRIVSYKSFNQLTVGEKLKVNGGQGIGGGICNIVYYPEYISKLRIRNQYNYFKDKNPPSI